MVVLLPSPEASESEHGGGSTGVPEWQLRDWDDYYFSEDAGGAGGGGSGADPFAHISVQWMTVDEAIHGMTVDKAIQVCITYCMLYNIT
jgi:hypothetical protein